MAILSQFASGTSGPDAMDTLNARLMGPLTTPALKQVATACNAPTISQALAGNFMSKSVHDACDTISALAIVTPWFWIDSSGNHPELPAPNSSTATVAAWVEYPRGTLTPLTWGGNATTVITGGSMAQSDLVTLPVRIPRGARFGIWHRVVTSAAGRVLTVMGGVGATVNDGGGIIFSVASNALPLTAALGDTDTGTTFRPIAILAMTTVRSFLLLTDSRGAGVGDRRSNGNPDIGEIGKGFAVARSGPIPYIQYGQGGHGVTAFLALSGAQRANAIALGALISDGAIQWGINDTNNSGIAAATVMTGYGQIKALFAPIDWWLTTKGPVSTSTDSWATTANQTTNANNGIRVTLNNTIRAYPSGYKGFLELADPVESGRNSGLWKATGSASGYTNDGVHGEELSYNVIRDSGQASPRDIL